MGIAGAGSENPGDKSNWMVKYKALGADDQYDADKNCYSRHILFTNCARLSAINHVSLCKY